MDDLRSTPPSLDQVINDLRQFFQAAMRGPAPDVDDDYFAAGRINSLFALELVTFVERHFSITVEVADLELDNFRTIGRTANFVRTKLTIPATAGGPDGRGDVRR